MEPEESGRRKEYSLERFSRSRMAVETKLPTQGCVCINGFCCRMDATKKGSRHWANCGTGTSWKKCRYRRPETMARLLNRMFSFRTPPTQRTEALAPLVFKDEHARAMEGMAGTRTGQSCPCLFFDFSVGPRSFHAPTYELSDSGLRREPLRQMDTAQHGHEPVLLNEALELLSAQLSDVVLDCTTGRGGHALALAGKIGTNGTLLCLDVDPVNLAFAKQRLDNIGPACRFFRPILRSCRMCWMPLKFPPSM